jgi:hypothetical protein
MKQFFTFIFFVTVNLMVAQNSVPAIDAVSDQTVNEDAPEQSIVLTGISDGGDGGQTLNLSVTTDNPDLFSKLEIELGTSDTTLVFKPAADSSGVAKVTISVSDPDGTTETSFNITVNEINDLPTIAPHKNITVLEDTKVVEVELTGISAGPPNESQNLTFSAYSTNPNLLFSNMPVTYNESDSVALLKLYVIPDSSGYTNMFIRVMDDSTEYLFSPSIDFKVTVLPVNDPPSMDILSDIVVKNDGAEHTVTLTGVSPGPANESDQSLTFSVESDYDQLFSYLSIDHVAGSDSATLKFTPAYAIEGTANVTITLNDDGGTGNGGSDITTQTFAITVYKTMTSIAKTRNNELSLYPNPASDVLNIRLPGSGFNNAEAIIRDISGKELSRTVIESNSPINISSLPKGIYSITIIKDGKLLSGKFIVK